MGKGKKNSLAEVVKMNPGKCFFGLFFFRHTGGVGAGCDICHTFFFLSKTSLITLSLRLMFPEILSIKYFNKYFRM